MSSPIIVIQGLSLASAIESGDAAYLADVSALRGANSLEAVTTVGLGAKTLVLVVIDGKIDFWTFTAGPADALDPDNQVAPLDYDATTNNFHWERSGGFVDGLKGIQVTRAAAQGIDSGVDTAISFDTERSNTGEFDSSSPTRFTCVKPGVYAVTGSISYASNASGQRKLFVRKNGGGYVAADVRNANSTGSTVVAVSTLIYLQVGDYLELIANQSSGGSLDAQKIADYSPEFDVIWLGNPVATSMPTLPPSTGTNDTTGNDDTISQKIVATDAGWYRIVSADLPATGGFQIKRTNQADGSVLDCFVQFGVFGSPDIGVIQLTRNVMTSDIQGIDAVRASYEGSTGYLDIHVTLPGTFEIDRPVDSIYVDAPFVVDMAGADGQKTFNVTPNVIGSTEAVEAKQVNSSGIKIASPAADGWVAPTGTLSRTTFDTATVTLVELAKRVAALITDELAFGSIHTGLPSNMIYTDMLSLLDSLVVEGTSVDVNDIFRITAAPDTSIEGIYVPVGTANGHTLYRLQGYEWNTALTRCVRYDGGTQWEIYGPSGILYRSLTPASPAEPWDVTQWQDTSPANVSITTVAPNVTLIFNVLTDTHTATYVKYATDSTYNGVYLWDGSEMSNGKRVYRQLNPAAPNRRIEWDGVTLGWQFNDDTLGVTIHGALSDNVDYPDQVSSWNVDISALRMDAVDLASGCVVSGGGPDTDGIYFPQSGVYSGRQTPLRRIDGLRYLNADTASWWLTDGPGSFGTVYARSNTFGRFPWQAAWTSLIVQEKNVAGPTNWHL